MPVSGFQHVPAVHCHVDVCPVVCVVVWVMVLDLWFLLCSHVFVVWVIGEGVCIHCCLQGAVSSWTEALLLGLLSSIIIFWGHGCGVIPIILVFLIKCQTVPFVVWVIQLVNVEFDTGNFHSRAHWKDALQTIQHTLKNATLYGQECAQVQHTRV